MHRVLFILTFLLYLSADDALDQIQTLKDPLASNSTTLNEVTRSLLISVVKKISDTGDEKEVFVRLYTPIQSNERIKVIENSGLANIELESQVVEMSMSDILRQGGIFVPVKIGFHPNTNASTQTHGYAINISAISQNIDTQLTSPTYLKLPSILIENNMHNQQIIATNPNRSQQEANALNQDKQAIVYANFIHMHIPLFAWFTNVYAFFSYAVLSQDLVQVPASDKSQKYESFTFFLPACGLDSLSEGTYSFRFSIKMVPYLTFNSQELINTKKQNFENIREQINAYTLSLSTITAELKNRNQLRDASVFENALYSIRTSQILKQRISLTTSLLDLLSTTKASTPDTKEFVAFINSIKSNITTYSNLKTKFLSELADYRNGLDPLMLALENKIDSILLLQSQEKSMLKSQAPFEKVDNLNSQIIQTITSVINENLLISASISSDVKNILEYRILFLMQSLYSEYNIQRGIVSNEIKEIETKQLQEARQTNQNQQESINEDLLQRIQVLEKLVETRLNSRIYPSTLNLEFLPKTLLSIRSKLGDFTNNQSATLGVNDLTQYNLLQGQREILNKEIAAIVASAISISKSSLALREYYSCQIEFFLGLSSFYLEDLRLLRELEIQEQQKEYSYKLQQEDLRLQIESLKRSQNFEIQETQVNKKAALNSLNLQTVNSLTRFLNSLLEYQSLRLFQIQYYQKLNIDLTRIRQTEITRSKNP